MTAVPRSASGAGPARVALAVLLAGLVPWSVQTSPGTLPFVRFLPTYLGLSGSPLLGRWLFASACWLSALGSAALEWTGREDARVTAGLLVLAGGVNASVALSFGVQPARASYPVGSVALWAVAAWRYRAATARDRR